MFKILKYFFLVAIIIGSAIAFYAYNSIFGNYVKEDVYLTIPSASSYQEVLESLKKNNLIKNEHFFSLLANKMNYPNNIYSGKYEFEKGISLYDVLVKLRGAHQSPVKLTINNVNFKQDLAGKIGAQLEIDSASFLNYINNDSAISKLGYNKDNILCLFIPNTYEFYWNVSFNSFIEKFEKEHATFWNETRTKKANKLDLTPNEVFILASIVEKEYKFADERKRIAGVYINRIKKGMKLQADPTVKFAIGDLSLKRVLTVHTEYDNPYNTYYYAGLPPGPICLPETSTIEDVLNAEEHNYIYFCAKADLSGYHTFNTNYNGHLNAARLYQAALNKLRIYE